MTVASFDLYNFIDDGIIPNSKYPVIVYHHVSDREGDAAANFLQHRFAENGWSNAFRWRVYNYHHYHTNTHEVLGVYAGNAMLQLGGPMGEKLHVRVGDVIVLPAGTGHIALSNSDDFAVVGAYPDGMKPDLIKLEDERPENVLHKVDSLPMPQHDPLYGDAAGAMFSSWNKRENR
ncbi:MAG: cupin domain-containing protein [Pedobacter sp.]